MFCFQKKENQRKQQHTTNHNAAAQAATIIQTAFRGYLARRALKALKGLVKLQALVRGHNVRKQAKMTLKCMQALVRVQARVLDQRFRQSEQASRKSDTTTSHQHMSSTIPDDWDERPHTIEEVKAMLQKRKEAAFMKCQGTPFSQQTRRSGRSSSIGSDADFGEKRAAAKSWDSSSRGRASTYPVEMDTSQRNLITRLHQRPTSPLHTSFQFPVTPSPSKSTRPIQVRSASPRHDKKSQTPSLRPNNNYSSYQPNRLTSSAAAIPNYMAATESALARIRSQSAPRQRPSTPERDRAGSAKKRLSFPVPDRYGNVPSAYGHNLRSPSFKSLSGVHFGYEQQSNYSSCYTESIGGEISPSSTSDFRRYLR